MVEKLARVTPAWAKVHAGNQRALIAAEALALTALRRAVKSTHAITVDEIAKATSQAHVFAALQAGRTHMAAAVAATVASARQDARVVADERIGAELEQARCDIERQREKEGAALVAMLLLLRKANPVVRASEDRTIGATEGDAFASAWSAAMMAALLKWRRESSRLADLAARLRGIPEQNDYRVRRIAATETSRAYNDQHDDQMKALAGAQPATNEPGSPLPTKKPQPEPPTTTYQQHGIMAGLYKRWDATLDRRTCAICRDHDGEIVTAGGPFRAGDLPGDVHPNCRCIETLVYLPGRIADA